MSDEVVRLVLTRPALDRLLGGDAALEVEIKHAAAKEIMDKHIVPTVERFATQHIIETLKAHVRKELETSLGKTVGSEWSRGFQLKPEIVEALNKSVDIRIKDLVDAAVNKKLEEIEEYVKSTVDYTVECRIREGVKARLTELRNTI